MRSLTPYLPALVGVCAHRGRTKSELEKTDRLSEMEQNSQSHKQPHILRRLLGSAPTGAGQKASWKKRIDCPSGSEMELNFPIAQTASYLPALVGVCAHGGRDALEHGVRVAGLGQGGAVRVLHELGQPVSRHQEFLCVFVHLCACVCCVCVAGGGGQACACACVYMMMIIKEERAGRATGEDKASGPGTGATKSGEVVK